MSDLEEKTYARQFVSSGLKRLVLGSGLVTKEKDLKGWFKNALGLSYSGAWRKLECQAPWEEKDLQRVANGLGITMECLLLALSCDGTKVETANIDIAGSQMYVRVVVGLPIAAGAEQGLVAYEAENEWHVVRGFPALRVAQPVLYQVLAINLHEIAERKRMVALIDDEMAVTQTASELFKLDAINTKCFVNEESFLAELQKTKFDAYVVDWCLSTDPTDTEPGTSENLIRSIRASEHGATAPIIVVTGKVQSDSDVVVDDLTRVSRDYNCTPMTKPVQWRFVAQDLVKRIRDDASKSAMIVGR